jgi:soluble lytic murein transglycosylase-like protein/outer membrane protein assembly factor BamD (BamD/ComL family)
MLIPGKRPFLFVVFCVILPLAFFLSKEAAAGLTPVQKEFVAGYKAYKSGKLEEAKKHFENCDGRYPVLQKHITALMKKIEEDGEKFFYFDPVENARAEIEILKKEPEEISFKLAKAYFKAREYEKAAALFNRTAGYKEFRLSSLERLATSLARLGRNGESILINQQIIEEFGNNKQAKALAMYKVGFLYMDRGDFKTAEDQFLALSDFFSSYKRDLVRWHLAWCAYKQGHFDDAAKRFAKLEKIKALKERARYWNAEALEKAIRLEDASSIYREIFEKAPKTYYGILAAKKLGEKSEESLSFPSATAEESHGETEFPDIFAAAIELDSLGLNELVTQELESLISFNNKKNDSALFVSLAAKNGAWHLYYLFDHYPAAYENLVLRSARKYKVDPLLVWAVMREESTFRQNAVSISGAVGLMQLMPKTAGSMMKRKFKPEELLNPQLNIEAGVRYLSFLLKRYKNNMFVTLAAYNAGEDAIDKWLSFYPRGPINGEEFAEAIPYKETQNYVKKVMRAYWIYISK